LLDSFTKPITLYGLLGEIKTIIIAIDASGKSNIILVFLEMGDQNYEN
jgi:hypothetical protein